MISTKIVITNFRENNESDHSCFSTKLRRRKMTKEDKVKMTKDVLKCLETNLNNLGTII